MSCCGNAGRDDARPGVGRAGGRPVLFEYTGPGPLTLYGVGTGVRYRWAGPGARVLVDARDAGAIGIVRGLEAVHVAPGA